MSWMSIDWRNDHNTTNWFDFHNTADQTGHRDTACFNHLDSTATHGLAIVIPQTGWTVVMP